MVLIYTQDDYHYVPLKTARSIRTLHLDYRSFRCRLQEVQLGGNVKYTALSYTWGDPTETVPILMEDPSARTANEEDPFLQLIIEGCEPGEECIRLSSLNITVNLAKALLQLQETAPDVPVWADAICINQNDLDERSSQVQIMADIYKEAELVSIWLGPADGDSELAFDWLERAHGSLAERAAKRNPNWSARDLLAPEIAVPWWDEVHLHGEELDAVLATFTHRKSRKWWERKWVVQEQAYGKSVVFACGARSVSYQALARVIGEITWRCTLKPTLQWDSAPGGEAEIASLYLTSTITGLMDFKIRALGLPDHQPHTIEEAIHALHHARATDPRDNIFALLSLCRFPTATLKPDYTRSTLDVYHDAARIMILDSGSLAPICNNRVVVSQSPDTVTWRENEAESVPSWLPDMGGVLLEPELTLIPPHLYNACQNRPLDLQQLFNLDRRTLTLEAIFVDAVSQIGPKYAWALTLDSDDELFWHWSHRNADLLLRQGSPSQLAGTIRTLVMDRSVTAEGDHFRLPDPCATVEDYMAAYLRLGGPIVEHSSTGHEKIDEIESTLTLSRLASPNPERDKACEREFCNSIRKIVRNGWLLCRTVSNRLAWVPDHAQKGDLVYVIYGSRVPFLLRSAPSSEERTDNLDFRMIGTVYVEGMMDGEILDEEASKEKNVVNLRLH